MDFLQEKGMDIIMAKVWTMGELLCEVMRPDTDMTLYEPGVFMGPYPSGAPGIFIDTVARLGHSGGIIGGVGKDDFGKCIMDRLASDGVDCSLITEYEEGTTGVAFVTYFEDGSRKFLYHFPNTPATWSKAPKAKELGEDIQYFHVMGCSLMACPSFASEILKLVGELATKGVKFSFDPNIRPELMRDESVLSMIQEVMKHTHLLLPGVSELLQISGQPTIQEAIGKCFENPKLEVIALKRGAQGVTVYTRTQEIIQEAYPVHVIDPTGAGDCFDGAFVCGMIEERPLQEVAAMATAAGALNTMALGPMEGDITPETIRKMIKE